MGVLYVVWPLDDEIRGWVAEVSESTPPPLAGRHPTPAELRTVLNALPDATVQYVGDWSPGDPVCQALVSTGSGPDDGPWTLAELSKVTAEDRPAELTFEKGCPELIILILSRLAVQCGPLVLIDDAGSAPLVVEGGADSVALFEAWK
jgi:hypothetical protein